MNSSGRRWRNLKPDKVLAMLGLANRAGRIECGGFCTERAVKGGRAACVVMAGDSSENTKNAFRNMCAYYGVPLYFYSSKAELGHALGRESRACAAVTDAGLAEQIRIRLEM